MLWRQFLAERTDPWLLSGLTITSLLLGTAVSENLLLVLLHAGHPALASLLQFGHLVLAGVLVLHQLWRYSPLQSSLDNQT